MNGKVFIDTNVFVYSIDASPEQRGKLETARRIVKELIRKDQGVVSIQVLQEFYNTATKKIEVPLAANEALEYLRYMSILEIVQPDFDLIVAAIHLHQKHLISFWDALILQAAHAAGCVKILSEDLQHGFDFNGLSVENPFLSVQTT